jgi:phage terminase large subunit
VLDQTKPGNAAAEAVLRVRRDPIGFVEQVFGEKVLGKQRDILQALAQPGIREVHAKSCHAAGKTHVCARACAWFLNAYPGDAIVVTTAPVWSQIEDQIWREIRDGAGRAKVSMGGTLLKTSWELGPKWYAKGIATSAETAVNIQGYHASHVLVIVDEADGVAQAIWDAVDGLTTSAHVVVLAIGNPINPGSAWRKRYDLATQDPRAVCIRIAADDVLPLTDGGKHPYLLQREWVENKKLRWGETSALYIAKVMAEWPENGADVLIPLSWLYAARGRTVQKGPRVVGVDVARFGTARTVRTLVEGNWLAWTRATEREDTMLTANRVYADVRDSGPLHTIVDDTGVGGAVTDRLRQMGVVVTPVNFGGRPHDQTRFSNRGSEIYWNTRQAFEENLIGFDMRDPEAVDELIADLSQPRYANDEKGRIRVDKYGLGRGRSELSLSDEQRTSKSPDRGDSFVIAYSGALPMLPNRPVVAETELQRFRREVYARAGKERMQDEDMWNV